MNDAFCSRPQREDGLFVMMMMYLARCGEAICLRRLCVGSDSAPYTPDQLSIEQAAGREANCPPGYAACLVMEPNNYCFDGN